MPDPSGARPASTGAAGTGVLAAGIGGSSEKRPRGNRLRCAIAITIAILGVAANGCTQASTSLGPSPAKCEVSLGTVPSAVDASGGSVSVPVTTQSECAWNATTDVNWMSVRPPASGQGTGAVDLRIAPNPSATVRQGGVTVNGLRVQIVQAAAQCEFILASDGQTFAAAGGSGTVAVTAAAGCAWNVTDAPGWITIASGASGSGAGTVAFTVAINPSGSPRTATLTIAGQPFPVTQQPTGCSYAIDRNAETVPAAGGPGTPIVVTSTVGCAWTATSSAPWITVTPANGTGSGTVNFSVAANPNATPRTGTVIIAGQTFTVTEQLQSAACSYALDHVSESIRPAGGAGTPIQVVTTPGCAWTATSSVPWLTGVTPGSGTGNGTVTFSVAVNTDTSPRTGTLTIAGQTFTMTQQGQVQCSYALDHASQSFSAAGGAGTPIQISATSGCTWTATSGVPWITIVAPANGAGNGTANFSVAANPSGTSRTGALTAAGKTFTVTQQGAACSYSLDHASQSFPAAGGAGTPIMVIATAGCAWTTTVNGGVAWITIVGSGSGTGNGTVNFSVAMNPSGTSRTSTLTVAGLTFTVTQQAAACVYSLDHASQSFPATGGAGTQILVTATPGCAWTAVVNPGFPWITIAGPTSGTGNGTVHFNVAANLGTMRTGTMLIATRTFTVTQAPH